VRMLSMVVVRLTPRAIWCAAGVSKPPAIATTVADTSLLARPKPFMATPFVLLVTVNPV
jgi:hypothetical protein